MQVCLISHVLFMYFMNKKLEKAKRKGEKKTKRKTHIEAVRRGQPLLVEKR